jgi:archaellum component FlaC
MKLKAVATGVWYRNANLKLFLTEMSLLFYMCSQWRANMSEVTDLVIPMLQQIQSRLTNIESDISDVKEDLHHIKVRVSSMEENVGGMNRRLDRLDTKFERVEKRLGLFEV